MAVDTHNPRQGHVQQTVQIGRITARRMDKQNASGKDPLLGTVFSCCFGGMAMRMMGEYKTEENKYLKK